MKNRYVVIGNPVEHSQSPKIHALFSEQTGDYINYETLHSNLDQFEKTVDQFIKIGGNGANITVPFKEEAYAYAEKLTARASAARAVNLLKFEGDLVTGDNTDGVGLIRDLTVNIGLELKGKSILLLGAGGAARGVLSTLLSQEPKFLLVVNRTKAKADMLVAEHRKMLNEKKVKMEAAPMARVSNYQFDIVINATAVGLTGDKLRIPEGIFRGVSVAYDMMYGAGARSFLDFARDCGAKMATDGLGMLVEQAAESFFVWRGVKPKTLPVINALRAELRE